MNVNVDWNANWFGMLVSCPIRDLYLRIAIYDSRSKLYAVWSDRRVVLKRYEDGDSL